MTIIINFPEADEWAYKAIGAFAKSNGICKAKAARGALIAWLLENNSKDRYDQIKKTGNQ